MNVHSENSAISGMNLFERRTLVEGRYYSLEVVRVFGGVIYNQYWAEDTNTSVFVPRFLPAPEGAQ